MVKRRYTIEASIDTLSRFVTECQKHKSEVFIQRVTSNSTEEYYFVVLIATPEVHKNLKERRFDNSHTLT